MINFRAGSVVGAEKALRHNFDARREAGQDPQGNPLDLQILTQTRYQATAYVSGLDLVCRISNTKCNLFRGLLQRVLPLPG